MATIEHIGKVISVTNGTAQIALERTSACIGCQAKAICGTSDSDTQLVTAQLTTHQHPTIGDEVKVIGRSGLGTKAILLAYVLPLLLVLSMLILGNIVGWTEVISGLVALLIIVPYAIILWLSRERLNKTFTFTIEI